MPFTVIVRDNFHYMDESEHYKYGEYETYEAAVTACKAIVDGTLADSYKKGMCADDLYQSYMMFGDDPFIVPTPEGERFYAWGYAKQRCANPTALTGRPKKTIKDWPFDLSGENILATLSIVRERMKDNEHHQKSFLLIQEARKKETNLTREAALKLVEKGFVPEENEYEAIRNVSIEGLVIASKSEDNPLENEDTLPIELKGRIERFLPVFDAVNKKTYEEWIEELANDLPSTTGIEFWEFMAESLIKFSMSEVSIFEQYKEAYNLLLAGIMEGKEAATKKANLELLNSNQVSFLLSGC